MMVSIWQYLALQDALRKSRMIRERRRSVERDEVTHHICVYLSAYRGGKMGQDLAYNLKNAKGHFVIPPQIQGVAM